MIDDRTIDDRFLEKVVVDANSCHLWIGSRRTPAGYGQFTHMQRKVSAHRYAWERAHALEIPAGMFIDHLCRNPMCVNPRHLEVVTPRENVLRGRISEVNREKARARTHCRRGHPFDAVNTYVKPSGFRSCRACERLKTRQRKAAAA